VWGIAGSIHSIKWSDILWRINTRCMIEHWNIGYHSASTAGVHAVPPEWLCEASDRRKEKGDKLAVSVADADTGSVHSGPAQVLLQAQWQTPNKGKRSRPLLQYLPNDWLTYLMLQYSWCSPGCPIICLEREAALATIYAYDQVTSWISVFVGPPPPTSNKEGRKEGVAFINGSWFRTLMFFFLAARQKY